MKLKLIIVYYAHNNNYNYYEELETSTVLSCMFEVHASRFSIQNLVCYIIIIVISVILSLSVCKFKLGV